MRIISLNVNWANTSVPQELVDLVGSKQPDIIFLHEVKQSFLEHATKELRSYNPIQSKNPSFYSTVAFVRGRAAFRFRDGFVQVKQNGISASSMHFRADVEKAKKIEKLKAIMDATPGGVVIGDPNCTTLALCFGSDVDPKFEEARNPKCSALNINCQRKPLHDRAWVAKGKFYTIEQIPCSFTDHDALVLTLS